MSTPRRAAGQYTRTGQVVMIVGVILIVLVAAVLPSIASLPAWLTTIPSLSHPTPVRTEQARAFGGEGSLNTDPFALAGGEYRVEWTAQRPTSGADCFHALRLEASDANGRNETLVTVNVNGPTQQGTAFLRGVATGRYVIRANSGCRWTVTLTPA